MNIQELIAEDIKKNNLGITVEDAVKSLMKFSASGARFLAYGNTVFVVYKATDTAVFFHTINAENIKQFLVNLKQFFADMNKAGVQYAITYFSNDKLKSVYRRYGDEVVGSEDLSRGKYKGITNLRRWQNGLG